MSERIVTGSMWYRYVHIIIIGGRACAASCDRDNATRNTQPASNDVIVPFLSVNGQTQKVKPGATRTSVRLEVQRHFTRHNGTPQTQRIANCDRGDWKRTTSLPITRQGDRSAFHYCYKLPHQKATKYVHSTS
jgi:hypothetical protein